MNQYICKYGEHWRLNWQDACYRSQQPQLRRWFFFFFFFLALLLSWRLFLVCGYVLLRNKVFLIRFSFLYILDLAWRQFSRRDIHFLMNIPALSVYRYISKKQCCGSGMIYSGSGSSYDFSEFRIRLQPLFFKANLEIKTHILKSIKTKNLPTICPFFISYYFTVLQNTQSRIHMP